MATKGSVRVKIINGEEIAFPEGFLGARHCSIPLHVLINLIFTIILPGRIITIITTTSQMRTLRLRGVGLSKVTEEENRGAGSEPRHQLQGNLSVTSVRAPWLLGHS